jgi:murein DD-endopeptidase MepM/ murein hydrolase activator NlpD
MDPVSAKMALQLAATVGRSRSLRYLIVGVVAGSVLVGLTALFGPWIMTTELAAAMRGSSSHHDTSSTGPCPAQIGGTAPPAAGLSSEQVTNAKIIWTAAQQMSVGDRGAVIAITAALQESSLRNLPYGDLDSVGLFQQRASWGSHAARTNPVEASRMFFQALTKINGWQQLPIGVAAQAVERSAFPSAYTDHEQQALGLVRFLEMKYGNSHPETDAITGSDPCEPTTSPGKPGQIGLPVDHYVLTARFGQCSSHWANCHTGLDFAAPTGTPIHAVMGGKVVWTGWGGAYGNLTKIQNAGNLQTWYAHQSAIKVKVGQTVTEGQTIGLVGATGNTTGPHVHLEVRTNGTPVDPQQWLTNHGVKP